VRTIASFKSDLIRKLHGTSLSKVQSVNDTIAEAGRTVLTRLDPQETIRVATIENALFDDVTSYTAPSDLKGDKVIDLQPQTGRVKAQNYTKVMIEEFGRNKTSRNFTVEYRNGTKFLKLKEPISSSKTVLSETNELTGWAVSSSADNLTLDSRNFITTTASLKFDIDDSSTTAIIENSTLDSVDLSTYSEENSLFVWVYIPDASKITSMTARLGSNSSNYYSKTITTPHNNSVFTEGWNLLRFDYEDGTETGTADWSAIAYFRLTITHDQTGSEGFRLDSVQVGIGKAFEVVYYGDKIFRGIDGTYKSVPTLDTDIIQLEDDAYNVMLYESCYLTSQELQGENGSFDETYFRRILEGDGSSIGLYRRYHMMYPSQNKKARSSYYKLSKGVYGR